MRPTVIDEDDDEDAGLGCLIAVASVAASAAFTLWLGWLTWEAIKRRDVTDLLILAGIFIAFPAWHMVSRALEHEHKDEMAARVSDAWLKEHGGPQP